MADSKIKKHFEHDDEDIDLRKKEFTYRGKSLEVLKELEIREFAKLLKANEKRTVMRQYDEIQNFIARAHRRMQKNKAIRTHLRHLVIVPRMIGLKLNIHNGNTFVPLQIEGEMLGHRLGEFAGTRQKVKHGAAGIGATKSSSAQSVK